MEKPAFIFDGRKLLDHKMLLQIGFHVETVGVKLHENNWMKIQLAGPHYSQSYHKQFKCLHFRVTYPLIQWFSTFGSKWPTKQDNTQFGDPFIIVLKHAERFTDLGELNLPMVHGGSILDSSQGILSIPGIAGYGWVPARIDHFYNYKIFFSYYKWPIKNSKNGYSFVSSHFPCSVFPARANSQYCPSCLQKYFTIQKWSNLTQK